MCELPTEQLVVDYFRWRQSDATRCALNGWCYWTLRKAGRGVAEAGDLVQGEGGRHQRRVERPQADQHQPNAEHSVDPEEGRVAVYRQLETNEWTQVANLNRLAEVAPDHDVRCHRWSETPSAGDTTSDRKGR